MRTPPSPVLDPGDIATQLDGWVVPDKMLSAALADRLASLISGGGLPAGFRLPSQRQLAKALNVSHNTVGTAYEILCMQGMLDPRRSYAAPGALRGV